MLWYDRGRRKRGVDEERGKKTHTEIDKGGNRERWGDREIEGGRGKPVGLQGGL